MIPVSFSKESYPGLAGILNVLSLFSASPAPTSEVITCLKHRFKIKSLWILLITIRVSKVEKIYKRIINFFLNYNAEKTYVMLTGVFSLFFFFTRQYHRVPILTPYTNDIAKKGMADSNEVNKT